MAKLRFLFRVLLLCNGCYLITLFPALNSRWDEHWTGATVLTMGRVIAPAGNLLAHALLTVFVLAGRKPWIGLPRWILVSNLLVFVLQLIFLMR